VRPCLSLTTPGTSARHLIAASTQSRWPLSCQAPQYSPSGFGNSAVCSPPHAPPVELDATAPMTSTGSRGSETSSLRASTSPALLSSSTSKTPMPPYGSTWQERAPPAQTGREEYTSTNRQDHRLASANCGPGSDVSDCEGEQCFTFQLKHADQRKSVIYDWPTGRIRPRLTARPLIDCAAT
jgi:hypothetical protein